MTELLEVTARPVAWKAAGRVQGQTVAPELTDLGRRQAAAAAAHARPTPGPGAAEMNEYIEYALVDADPDDLDTVEASPRV